MRLSRSLAPNLGHPTHDVPATLLTQTDLAMKTAATSPG